MVIRGFFEGRDEVKTKMVKRVPGVGGKPQIEAGASGTE